MDDIRCPTQFLNCFQNTLREEDHAHVVIGEHVHVLVVEKRLAMKKLLIINEVHLKSDLRNAGHLDDQGVIGIVDNQIHSAQTDHFVQLMATLVDFTIPGHEDAGFFSAFVDGLRK